MTEILGEAASCLLSVFVFVLAVSAAIWRLDR